MEEPTSDTHAIARLKLGDLAGLDALIERYQLQAVRTAYLIVRDRLLAEDIVQETFIQLPKWPSKNNFPFLLGRDCQIPPCRIWQSGRSREIISG